MIHYYNIMYSLQSLDTLLYAFKMLR